MIHAKMNAVMRRLGVMLTGILIAVPLIGAAGPNGYSYADIVICRDKSMRAWVCSSKELSNVVVQCGDIELETSYFFKSDDLDDPENWPEGQLTAYEGLFSCSNGNILAVFVKSGSKKYSGGLEGLPPGSGATFGLQDCPEVVVCPEPSEEDEEEVGDGEIPTEEIPE